jgi:hypothetical protein
MEESGRNPAGIERKKRMSWKLFALAATGVSLIAMPALAHHSFAMFDNTKIVEVSGTVSEFEYINPHSWVHIKANNPQGREVTWSFEMGSVSQLARDKWDRNTVKVGDQVTVSFHPLRDGSYGGQFRLVKFADGRVVCQAGAGNMPCQVDTATRPQRAPQE